MKLNKLTFVFALFLSVGLTVNASADVSCGVKYTSAYVLNIGVRATTPNEGAIQGSCTVSNTSGLYGGVWASQSTRNPGTDETKANEVDLYGGRVFVVKGVKVDLGVQYFDLVNPELFDGSGDFFNPFVKFAFRSDRKVRPYVELNGLVGIDSTSFHDGWYVKAGVVHDFGLGKTPLSLNLSGTHNEGVSGFTADILRASLAAPIKARGLTVTPSVSYSHPLGNEVRVKNETWFTVAFDF